jgi:hypothetical protein
MLANNNFLLRRSSRRLVLYTALLMLAIASVMQAAHFHKNEPLSGETHSLCALCIHHADRWIDVPRPLPLAIASVRWEFKVLFSQAPSYFGVIVRRYNSRAPPRI